MPDPDGRIVFDLSSAARWSGPPVGIVRVQRELGLWARRRRPRTVFAIFDPVTMGYRALAEPLVDAFLAGTAALNAWGLPDPTGRRKRRSQWVPAPLYDALQARRTLLRWLERVRLDSRRPWAVAAADRLQRRLITRRYASSMINPDGSRRPFPAPAQVYGPPIAFGRGDLLVCAGNGWSHSNIAAIAALKARTGFRLAVVCFDLIPLMFPHFFKPRDVADLSRYWLAALSLADLVVVNSRAVEGDVRALAAEQGLALGRLAVCPLGADPATLRSDAAAQLPAGLESGRYGLFVSTIEPRKGHEMLLKVWLRLLEAGVPQASGFKLVFLGRRGWMMEAFETALNETPRLAETLVILPQADDATLDALYRNAAFCLYPSFYEGYGLPVVEAFARGKAVIASNGGSLAEVVGAFSPCLDPRDEDAWFDTLGQWIVDPAARAPFEAAIRQRYRHPTWDDAAEIFYAEINRLAQGPAGAV
jgi:glycosyltransferase involved in cell wall biosynthesis